MQFEVCDIANTAACKLKATDRSTFAFTRRKKKTPSRPEGQEGVSLRGLSSQASGW